MLEFYISLIAGLIVCLIASLIASLIVCLIAGQNAVLLTFMIFCVKIKKHFMRY